MHNLDPCNHGHSFHASMCSIGVNENRSSLISTMFWLSIASSMIYTLWWILICNTSIFTLCVHNRYSFMCFHFRFPCFQSSNLSPSRAQTRQPCHSPLLMCLYIFHILNHKVGYQIYCLKLYPL